MKAKAIVEVALRGGRTTCVRLRSEPPLTLRRTGEGVVHQVSSGAGPIGGDELVVRVRVGAGATLVLRTVAASIVLPGPTGLPSRCTLDAEVEDGGRLVVLPEPQVLAGGADHEVRTTIRLGIGATLWWRDETVLGRHGDGPASLHHRLRVDRAGAPLLRTDLAIGPRWPDSTGPAGTDGARCIGTLFAVGDPAPHVEPVEEVCGEPEGFSTGSRAGVLEVAPGAVLVNALGPTASVVRRALHAAARPLVNRAL